MKTDSLNRKGMGIPLRKEVVMSKEIYTAAFNGDVRIFEETENDEYLLRKTKSHNNLLIRKTKSVLRRNKSNNNLLKKTKRDEDLLRKTFDFNNILHVAFKRRYYKEDFVGEAVSRYPHLLLERNLDGDTPLHLAAYYPGNEDIVREVCEKLRLDVVNPLRMTNLLGNTPFHVALLRQKPAVALIMLEKDSSLATILNKSLQAPLHLAIKYFTEFFDEDTVLEPRSRIKFIMKKKVQYIKMIQEKEHSWDYPVDEEEEDENEGYEGSETHEEIKIIMELLEKASHVAGWKDASGMTPLHLAASLDKILNLVVISYMIHCCPQSMEVCDNSGKTILHLLIHRILYYSEANDYLYEPCLYLLRDVQDHDGNTPLNLAYINKDFIMVELLGEGTLEPDHRLKNKAGESIITLVGQWDWTKMCHKAECGDVLTLKPFLDNKIGSHYYRAKNSDEKNLLHLLFHIKQGHIIIPERYFKFIRIRVRGYPHLLSDTDKNGDTPLHIIAQLIDPYDIMIHLATEVQDGPPYLENPYPGSKPNDPIFFTSSYMKYNYVWESLGSTTFLKKVIKNCYYENPDQCNQVCSKQNGKGNTPLHEAIIARNFVVFSTLTKICTNATTLVNNDGDTVLHLLATVNPTPPISDDLLRDIVKHHTEVGRDLVDKDGLTPLMRAIKAGNIAFAEKMCSLCQQIAELKGSNGETFWHLLAISPIIKNDVHHQKNDNKINFDVEKSLFFTIKVVRDQLKTKDKNEDTALHMAIDHYNFDAAKLFLSARTHDGTRNFHEQLLRIQRKDGKTPSELIGALPYLPEDFEEFIWKDSTMIGTRSMWRIPTSQMESYVNTMGVIAALLTTITFTAAFTVPGGLNQEKGTPLLISNPAFQVFMISNVLAMCLSMLVLFCLLWIMATGNKSKSVVLLDFSIMLLLASFYLTLLTFMTGLYATTYLVKPWVAILSLAMCSFFLLLMLIYLVGSLVIPSRKAIFIYAVKSYQYVKGSCKNSLSLIGKCFCPWSTSPRPQTHSPMPSNGNEIEASTLVNIEST